MEGYKLLHQSESQKCKIKDALKKSGRWMECMVAKWKKKVSLLLRPQNYQVRELSKSSLLQIENC